MNLEEDYIQYVLQFSLSILAISAAYFVDPSRIITFGSLLLIPVLFGYTAYVSRKGFQTASALALVSLIFAPLGLKMIIIALLISLGNILTSFFAHGESFKDYYSATMIPLLLTGLVIGGGIYGLSMMQPSTGEDVRSTVSNAVGVNTNLLLEEMQLIEMQQQSNRQVVQQTSSASILAAQAYVLNQTEENLTEEDLLAVQNAFSSAEEEIPAQFVERSSGELETVNISERVSDGVENLLTNERLILLVPIIGVVFYAAHPFVGFLVAISASLFAFFERKIQ